MKRTQKEVDEALVKLVGALGHLVYDGVEKLYYLYTGKKKKTKEDIMIDNLHSLNETMKDFKKKHGRSDRRQR